MKVNKNNFWLQLNQKFYDSTPKTLCGFFWKSIFAFVMVFTSPLVYIGHIINYIGERDKTLRTFGYLPYIDKGIQIIIYCTGVGTSALTVTNFLMVYVMVIIALIIFIAAIIGIGYVFVKIQNRMNLKRLNGFSQPIKEKKPNIIIESFKAIKGTVCPIIEIIDNE